MNKNIFFNVDQDNKPVLEKLTKDNIQDSLFANQYQYALKQIDYYVQTLSNQESIRNKTHGIDNNNNIFAFLGNRGTGKTSCMISLSEMLLSGEISKFKEFPNLSNKSFVGIDIIDPSYFDEEHNVVSLFLAKLYHQFCYVNERNYSYNSNEEDYIERNRQHFLQVLSETQKHLMCLLNNKEHIEDDTLESLGWLSASVDLRDDIKQLVDAYLQVVLNKHENSILVLEIDDIDLNTRQASKMAEQIRKYFIQPNVIVLMSLNLQQFIYAKINEVSSGFDSGINGITDINYLDIAEKYVNKFIPQSQRVYMPSTESFTNRGLTIESKSGENRAYLSIRQAVPELIFEKTRYLFYNNSLSESFIIPNNLRDLRQLIKLLYVLPDYNKEDVVSTIYNKDIFKDYLITTWARENVSHREQIMAQSVMDARDFSQVNRFMWDALFSAFGPSDYPFEDNSNLLPSINGTLTSGDIVSALILLESKRLSGSSAKFVFLLKSIYSIKLYEAYDSVTEGNTFDDTRNHNSNEIYRSELNDSLDDYSRLTYGVMFNTNITPFIRSKRNNIDYNQRNVDIDELKKLFTKCSSAIGNINNLSGIQQSELSSNVKLLEILMLGIRITPINDDHNNIYQSVSEDCHIIFDIGCLFYNLLHVFDKDWSCYERFGFLGEEAIKVLGFIKEDKNLSYKLWPCFVIRTITRNEDIEKALSEEDYAFYGDNILSKLDKNNWLSLCSFRNVEIMQDFLHYFQSVQYNPGDCADSYRIFFKKLGRYGINTYDKTSKGNSDYYKIRFRYGLDIAAIFKDPELSKEFNKILMSENLSNIKEQIIEPNPASGTTR
jgi:hypothetical protein